MEYLIRKRATEHQKQELAKHFRGYIKVVVDVEREILAGGLDRYFDEEKLLLDDGSKQKNLWGGGLDLETKEIDYNSVINLRPNDGNPSRDILDKKIRKKFDKIIAKLLF